MKPIITLILAVCMTAASHAQRIDLWPAKTGAQINATTDTVLVRKADATGQQASQIPFSELVNVPGFFTNLPNGSFTLAKLAQSGATTGQAAVWNGSAWAAATVTSNLTSGPVTSSAGVSAIADAALTIAKTSGLQTALDAKARTRSRVFSVYDYGARADGVTLYDGVFTSGSTAFSSASASFAGGDVGKKIVLQLSQTSRQILTISSVTDATHLVMSAAASASSSAYTYGIVTYGTDNSSAIQSAITAAGAAGGGEIQFEGGVYLCTAAPQDSSDVNAVFKIPFSSTIAGAGKGISFVGVGHPVMSNFNPTQVPALGGTVIYCPNQTVTGTGPSIFGVVKPGARQAALASADASPNTYWGAVTNTTLFRNLTIRQAAVPVMHALQFRYAGSLFVENVALDLDVPYSSSGNLLASPISAAATGVICPERLSGYFSNLNNLYVYGYCVGWELGDMSSVQRAVAEFCAIAMKGSVATNFTHCGNIGAYRCQTALSGPLKVNIDQLDIESYRGGGIDYAPSWCRNPNGNYEIDNYDNSINGTIKAYTVLAGTGPIPTTVRSADNMTDGKLTVLDGYSNVMLGRTRVQNLTLSAGVSGPTVTLATAGTAGSTTYKYRVAYVMPDGSELMGAEATISTGNATLTSTNKINITIPLTDGTGASYRVYRTSSAGTPSTTGYIGRGFLGNSATVFADTGLSGDGATAADSTGVLTVGGNTWNGSTISGAQAFSSTTRPTSAGTGTPAATSLITTADGDARYGDFAFSKTTASFDASSTTLADSGLSVTLAPGTWKLNIMCIFRNPVGTDAGWAANIKCTSGTTTFLNCRALVGYGNVSPTEYVADVDAIGSSTFIGPWGRSNNPDCGQTEVTALATVTTTSVIKVQVGQGTSSANVTRLKVGSWLEARRVTP